MKGALKYLLTVAVAVTVLSCTDTGSRLDPLRQQIEALKAAVQSGDGLVSFTPVVENGEISAYKAVFSKAGEITVPNGGDIIAVTEDAARVVFTFSDGSQIVILKPQALTITLQGDQTTIGAGESVTVAYIVTGADNPEITALCGDGWRATVTPVSATTGTIEITAPSPIAPDRVVVFVSDGNGRMVAVEMRLTIDTSGNPGTPDPPDPPEPPVNDPILVPVMTVYDFSKEGGQIEAGIITNTDYTVTTDASWLHYLGTKAVRTDNLLFAADPNEDRARIATATISAGNYFTTISFRQRGVTYHFLFSDDKFSFDVDGGTAKLYVSSNAPYTYSPNSGWFTINQTATGDEDEFTIAVSKNTTYDARTGIITFTSEKMGSRLVEITQRGRCVDQVPHSCIPVCHIMPCCRINNAGTKFLIGGKWDAAHDYQRIEDVRGILQLIKDAGINVISIDFTNASQWDDFGQSALHNGDGGEFWYKFGPMLDNIVKVCAEKDMKYFLFLGNSLVPTTTLEYWNFIAGVVLERWASDPHYLRYGFGDDRPMLVMFLPGSRFASQLRSAPASQKNNLLQFHIGTCQVNSPITFTTTDGWGYRNYSGSSDGKVRFACPNSGVPPQDWARVGAEEWKQRVAWVLGATEYAVIGSYDDTCDAIFWGIADVSQSTSAYHRNVTTVDDPYVYYNIVHDSLK